MSGLDVEWVRVQTIALNLANMNSTRTETGDVYRPLRLVSGPQVGFGELLRSGEGQFTGYGVKVTAVEEVPGGVRRTFEPNHPHADADGFVLKPNIDRGAEMTMLIKASRTYEANLTAMSIAHQMYSRALEMGRHS